MSNRVHHKLKPNKSGEIPTQWVFFDVETLPHKEGGIEKHSFRLVCAAFCDFRKGLNAPKIDRRYFVSLPHFWQWVLDIPRKKSRLILCAHNLNFDFQASSASLYLKNDHWIQTKRILGNPPIVLDYRKDERTIRFLDSFNYFPCSIERMGEMIGLEKLPMPDFSECDEKWTEYCFRDVEILMQSMIHLMKLIKSHDYGCFPISLAGLAFNSFRHKFMKHDIFIHSDDHISKMERESYFGGRVECFRIGKYSGKFYLLDVNSMYPYSMLGEFSTNYRSKWKNPSWKEIEKLKSDFLYILRGKVKVDLPLLPHRMKNKVIFPVGEFEGVWAQPEIENALKFGARIEPYEIVIYDKAPIFKDFVLELYDLRLKYKQDGNIPFSWIIKLILNSLYGKFGQRGVEWEEYGYNPDLPDGVFTEINGDNGEVSTFRVFDGLVEKKVSNDESYNSFPAISSFVTSYSRVHLWNLIVHAGMENVWYCDSDSLIVNEIGYEQLKDFIDEHELGKLKVENEATLIEIRGCKDYRLGKKEKIKGIRKNAIKLSEGEFIQPQFRSLLRAIREGETLTPTFEDIIKKMKRIYDKGIVQPDGRVFPITLL